MRARAGVTTSLDHGIKCLLLRYPPESQLRDGQSLAMV